MGLLASLRRLFRPSPPGRALPPWPQPPQSSQSTTPPGSLLPALERDWSASSGSGTVAASATEGADGMRFQRVQCMGPQGLHRMAYTQWGDPANPRVLICVHGLTRNARDFDFLAASLQDHYRVICPDVVGRGRSDWLKDPKDYGFPQYLSDMVTLIARLDVESVHWVGTSMGGLIGMMLAALPATPVSRLVMNDVGPVITAASLKRIGEYVGGTASFDSLDEAERYLRQTCAPFGRLDDAEWRHLTVHSVREGADRFWLRYDPGLAEPFRKVFVHADVKYWQAYDAVQCPTLVVRGAESDLLTADTAREMGLRGPRARLVEMPGVGHAPMFLSEEQVAPVREFLLKSDEALGVEGVGFKLP